MDAASIKKVVNLVKRIEALDAVVTGEHTDNDRVMARRRLLMATGSIAEIMGDADPDTAHILGAIVKSFCSPEHIQKINEKSNGRLQLAASVAETVALRSSVDMER